MTAAAPEKSSFNLMRWFSILSLVSIVLISAVSAFVLSRFLTQNLLQRDTVLTMELVNSILQVERVPANFDVTGPGRGDRGITQQSPGPEEFARRIFQLGDAKSYFRGRYHELANADIEEFFAHIARMPDVLRANVYLRDHSIIWSSNTELIGKKFVANPDLERAFGGQPQVKSGITGEIEKEEHVFFDETGVPFIENYLPIWLNDRRYVWGVIELYRTPRTLFEAIDEGNRLVWTGAAAGGLFLYATLFWIVRRGNTLIQRQHDRLVESETLAAAGEMASAVAHGLRNPLASIRSSAELALEDDVPGSVGEPLADIVRQADRLDTWVRQLLTSSRPATGDLERIQINDVVSQSVDGFVAQARKKGITMVLNSGDDVPKVEANAAALGHVLNSVIANAVEAMPDGGTLTLTTGPTRDGRAVELAVADTGKGMSRRQITKVFRPFVTTKSQGLGLGLPLARRIIERHGGILDLSSPKGKGTVVTMRIPVAG
ncbi:MAG: sensor histidine kinase [Rhodospirillales bacterium]